MTQNSGLASVPSQSGRIDSLISFVRCVAKLSGVPGLHVVQVSLFQSTKTGGMYILAEPTGLRWK